MRKYTIQLSRTVSALALAGTFLFAEAAAADVTLVEKDGWTVFTNGRMQAFYSYVNGDGPPRDTVDANNNTASYGTLDGGLKHGEDINIIYEPGVLAPDDPGKAEEHRIRTGFTGNVLGFGVKNQVTPDTEVMAYTHVASYIHSDNRRKYVVTSPDWREGFLRVTGPWGSVTAGRTGVLFSRGATELSFLYGYNYGVGWVGSITTKGDSYPGTAGACGFGVMCNGFAAGISYATPSLAGAKVEVGLYDANTLVGSGALERNETPRLEGEATYEMELGDLGMFKVFGNGAYQKFYRSADGIASPPLESDPIDADSWGLGYGGRVEVGIFHLGLAAHYGKGVGLDFAYQPHSATYHRDLPHLFRPVTGYHAQAMVSATSQLDLHLGGGITQITRLSEDLEDQVDNDDDAATPTGDDDGMLGPDSVGMIVPKHQLGLGGGLTFHVFDNLHLRLEYFRAEYAWYKPVPEPPEGVPLDGSAVCQPNVNCFVDNGKQVFHVVSAGVTADW